MVEQDRRAYTSCRICERRRKDTKNTGRIISPPLSYLLYVVLWSGMTSAHPLPDDPKQVRELNFSVHLSNPCSVSPSTPLKGMTAEERAANRQPMIRELKARVMLLNDTAATILRTNVLHDCSILRLPHVAIVPTADDILNCRPIEVLRLFYTSLLNHTAHVYFISDQLTKYKGVTCNSDGLPAAAKSLSNNLRELMCILRVSILTLTEDDYEDDYINDSTSQIMNEPLMDQPICSRRSVRDCQTVYSTVALLTEMTSYLRDKVLVEDEPS